MLVVLAKDFVSQFDVMELLLKVSIVANRRGC